MSKQNVLVITATGKQGTGFCEALLESNNYNIYGTSRTIPNDKLARNGIIAVPFKFGDINSINEALKQSNPDFVVIITDFAKAAGMNKITEENHGNIIIDACKTYSTVKHVIFSSVYKCDECPDVITAFKSKIVIENHLKESGLSYSILRPGGFFENFIDIPNYNPLVKGSLKGLFKTSVQYIACYDIGRAGVKIFNNYKEYNGKTINCVAYEGTSDDCVKALSKVSKVDCTFSYSLSPTFLWFLSFFIPFFYHMVKYSETPNPDGAKDIKEFREFLPEALDAEGYFKRVGQWSNGEKFPI